MLRGRRPALAMRRRRPGERRSVPRRIRSAPAVRGRRRFPFRRTVRQGRCGSPSTRCGPGTVFPDCRVFGGRLRKAPRGVPDSGVPFPGSRVSSRTERISRNEATHTGNGPSAERSSRSAAARKAEQGSFGPSRSRGVSGTWRVGNSVRGSMPGACTASSRHCPAAYHAANVEAR